ncbi:uncharacterized protein PgNI_10020 [Pyricularia grisea]|uniref:Uncharacterized protein n=1 Tax=Pyricularia grisea TaxID=148305 RepID=A0A6P8AS70_PYRGI|nr:uncharacterized protein PgNI_10020 [Pyricularia grisea]TLD04974.1 hypothetical protein PgNI_10020 [Pyricularia grisea]
MLNISDQVVTIHRGSHYIRHNGRYSKVSLWSQNPTSQKTVKVFMAVNATTSGPMRYIRKICSGYMPSDIGLSSLAWSTATRAASSCFGSDADAVRNARASLAVLIATRAAGVHPILAMLAPEADDHFALMSPRWVIIPYLLVNESTRITMTDSLQVPDTSMVVEAVNMLAVLVAESKVRLVKHGELVKALLHAYINIKINGIGVAPYSSWFLEGHSVGSRPLGFTQVPPVLCSRWGAGCRCSSVIRHYNKIPGVLRDAEAQLCRPYDRHHGSVLGRVRAEVSKNFINEEKGDDSDVLAPHIDEAWFKENTGGFQT